MTFRTYIIRIWKVYNLHLITIQVVKQKGQLSLMQLVWLMTSILFMLLHMSLYCAVGEFLVIQVSTKIWPLESSTYMNIFHNFFTTVGNFTHYVLVSKYDIHMHTHIICINLLEKCFLDPNHIIITYNKSYFASLKGYMTQRMNIRGTL